MARPKPIPWQPRGLDETSAATYCGVSPAVFRQLVDAGTFPKPYLTVGRSRIYDIRALDAAIDRLSFPGSRLAADIRSLDMELNRYEA